MEEDKTKKIIDYYEQRVAKYGTSGKSTLLDGDMRILEIETVVSWLSKTDTALDIFCANGVSTIAFSGHCRKITGIDLSPKMIETAQRLLGETRPKPKNVDFKLCSVLDIERIFRHGDFNTVISVRGLINLPAWELQKSAISKVCGLLPEGGKFILLEGCRDGLANINSLRKDFSLKALEEPWYDRHFVKSELDAYLKKHFSVVSERDLSPYFLISRVAYPKAVHPQEPEFGSTANALARIATPFMSCGKDYSLLTCRCLVKK